MKILVAAALLFLSLSEVALAESEGEENFALNDIAEEINSLRARYNIKPLALDLPLDCAAQKHALDIAPRNLCQHLGTDGSTLLDRARFCGSRAGAELVGCGYLDAKTAVSAWAGRLDGSKIIFDPTFTKIGTARVLNHFVVVLN